MNAKVNKKNKLSPQQLRKELGELKRANAKLEDALKGVGVEFENLKGVENTDAQDVVTLKDWAKMQESNKKDLGKEEVKKQQKRVLDMVKADTDDSAIIIQRKDGTLELIAGNTRASLRKVLGKPIKVHLFKERS